MCFVDTQQSIFHGTSLGIKFNLGKMHCATNKTIFVVMFSRKESGWLLCVRWNLPYFFSPRINCHQKTLKLKQMMTVKLHKRYKIKLRKFFQMQTKHVNIGEGNFYFPN